MQHSVSGVRRTVDVTLVGMTESDIDTLMTLIRTGADTVSTPSSKTDVKISRSTAYSSLTIDALGAALRGAREELRRNDCVSQAE